MKFWTIGPPLYPTCLLIHTRTRRTFVAVKSEAHLFTIDSYSSLVLESTHELVYNYMYNTNKKALYRSFPKRTSLFLINSTPVPCSFYLKSDENDSENVSYLSKLIAIEQSPHGLMLINCF